MLGVRFFIFSGNKQHPFLLRTGNYKDGVRPIRFLCINIDLDATTRLAM